MSKACAQQSAELMASTPGASGARKMSLKHKHQNHHCCMLRRSGSKTKGLEDRNKNKNWQNTRTSEHATFLIAAPWGETPSISLSIHWVSTKDDLLGCFSLLWLADVSLFINDGSRTVRLFTDVFDFFSFASGFVL